MRTRPHRTARVMKDLRGRRANEKSSRGSPTSCGRHDHIGFDLLSVFNNGFRDAASRHTNVRGDLTEMLLLKTLEQFETSRLGGRLALLRRPGCGIAENVKIGLPRPVTRLNSSHLGISDAV